MTDERLHLEQALLAQPFDLTLRTRYAALLFERGEFAASLAQWRLVAQQRADSAEPHVRAAQCCAELNDPQGVDEQVALAKAKADFDPHDPRVTKLRRAEEPEKPVAAPGLRLVASGPASLPTGGEVISISRADRVRFSDIVGMDELKQLLRMRIVEPFVRPGLFQRFKKKAGGGVLLYGPPGCGKTMMARAIATECQATFTAIGISDILNMWVGASERNLASIFEKARAEAPAVLFFDELDALAYSRSKAHSDHTRTLVNEFLNQLDGMGGRNERVLVLAATNMPWDVDEAMKRPGRFDRQIFVPPPDASARAEMFRAKLRGVPCEDIQHAALARACEHFSGADIDGVIEHAKDVALSDILTRGEERPLTQADLQAGLACTTPSTLDWLKTARNLVKFGGVGAAYKEVESYLRSSQLY